MLSATRIEDFHEVDARTEAILAASDVMLKHAQRPFAPVHRVAAGSMEFSQCASQEATRGEPI